MGVEQVVESVGIADTLLEHYAQTAKRVQEFLWGASDLARQSVRDKFESEIGEVNRTYPAIWEHLDRARGFAAALGRDVSGYDAIRGGLSAADVSVGARRISASREGAVEPPRKTRPSVLVESHLVSKLGARERVEVDINLDGAQAARDASHELKQSLPEVDWDAQARAATEAAVDVRSGGARLVSGTLMLIRWVGVLCLLAIVGFVVYLMFIRQNPD